MALPPKPALPPIPQPVLSPLTGAAIFLVVTVNTGGTAAARDLLSDCGGLQRSVGFRIPDGGLTCVVSVGSAAPYVLLAVFGVTDASAGLIV